jgi:hypothetical protein
VFHILHSNLPFLVFFFRGGADKVNLKREHIGPKKGYFYKVEELPTTIQAIPYVDLV